MCIGQPVGGSTEILTPGVWGRSMVDAARNMNKRQTGTSLNDSLRIEGGTNQTSTQGQSPQTDVIKGDTPLTNKKKNTGGGSSNTGSSGLNY